MLTAGLADTLVELGRLSPKLNMGFVVHSVMVLSTVLVVAAVVKMLLGKLANTGGPVVEAVFRSAVDAS